MCFLFGLFRLYKSIVYAKLDLCFLFDLSDMFGGVCENCIHPLILMLHDFGYVFSIIIVQRLL